MEANVKAEMGQVASLLNDPLSTQVKPGAARIELTQGANSLDCRDMHRYGACHGGFPAGFHADTDIPARSSLGSRTGT